MGLVLAAVIVYIAWSNRSQPHPVALNLKPVAAPPAKVAQPIPANQKTWPEYVLVPGKPGGNWTTVKPAFADKFTDLHLNPKLNPLHLTNEQIDILQDCYNKLNESRLAYEASIAKVDAVDGQVYIDIPAYPAEGVVLEQQFLDALTEKLGPDLTQAIRGQYLPEIVAVNAYMGQETQQLLASKDTVNPGLIKVVVSHQTTDGTSHGTSINLLTPDTVGSFGALARYFPHP